MRAKKITAASAALFLCHTLHAQEAGSVDLGGFELIPSLQVTLEKDDNITRSATDEIDSWKSIVSPEFILLNNFGANQLQFGYRLERGNYFSSSQDNYTDHILTALLDYELNSRNRSTTSLRYEDGHDDRGTAFSIGLGNQLTEPDTFKEFEFDTVYSYGAITADGRVDVNLNYRDLNYDGDETAIQTRDRDHKRIGAQFYYRVAPSTNLVVDGRYTDISYDVVPEGGAPLDSTEEQILVGVSWETSAATTSFAKVGFLRKDFDSPERVNFSGVKWEVGVNWQPVERTTFTLITNRDTRETNGEGDFIERDDIRVSWQHQWLERVRSRISVGYGEDDYVRNEDIRADKMKNARLEVIYQFKRWAELSMSYQKEDRDSNRATINYDRNVFAISARFTL